MFLCALCIQIYSITTLISADSDHATAEYDVPMQRYPSYYAHVYFMKKKQLQKCESGHV